MRPDQARALRKRRELAAAAQGAALRDHILNGASMDTVIAELIPTVLDRGRVVARIAKVGRQADRQPRGRARNRKIDELVPLIGELVVVDRVLELDRLQRAGLTPRGLLALSDVTLADMQAKLAELRGVVPSRLEVA